MKRMQSMLAAMLAVVMIAVLVFAPAVTARAEETEPPKPGTAELKIDTKELKLDMTACVSPAELIMSLAGTLDLGSGPIDATLFADLTAIAIQSSLLDEIYGIELKKATENFPGSIFAPGSGTMYELDASLVTAFSEGMKEGAEAVAPAAEATVSSELISRYTELAGEALTDGMEIGMRSEDLTLGGQTVATSVISFTLNNETIIKMFTAVADEAATDEELKAACGESLAARFSEEDAPLTADEFWEQMPRWRDETAEKIAESGICGTCLVYNSKETGKPCGITLDLTIEGDPLSIHVRFGNGEYSLSVLADEEPMITAVCTVYRSDEAGYAASLSLKEGELTTANVEMVWDKVGGEYICDMVIDEEATTVTGTMLVTEESTAITVDTINGEDPGDISLVLKKGGEPLPMPEFTELLTITEDEMNGIVGGVLTQLMRLAA